MSHTLSDETVENLDVIAAILIRCFFITVGAMLFTWVVWLVLGDVVHSIHGQMLEITRKEFDLFVLNVMTFMKGLNVLFFLFPFIAMIIGWFSRREIVVEKELTAEEKEELKKRQEELEIRKKEAEAARKEREKAAKKGTTEEPTDEWDKALEETYKRDD